MLFWKLCMMSTFASRNRAVCIDRNRWKGDNWRSWIPKLQSEVGGRQVIQNDVWEGQWVRSIVRFMYGMKAEIQLPLKTHWRGCQLLAFPPKSIAGWCQERHPVTKTSSNTHDRQLILVIGPLVVEITCVKLHQRLVVYPIADVQP